MPKNGARKQSYVMFEPKMKHYIALFPLITLRTFSCQLSCCPFFLGSIHGYLTYLLDRIVLVIVFIKKKKITLKNSLGMS